MRDKEGISPSTEKKKKNWKPPNQWATCGRKKKLKKNFSLSLFLPSASRSFSASLSFSSEELWHCLPPAPLMPTSPSPSSSLPPSATSLFLLYEGSQATIIDGGGSESHTRRWKSFRRYQTVGSQLCGGWLAAVALHAIRVAKLWHVAIAPPSLATSTSVSRSQQASFDLLVVMVLSIRDLSAQIIGTLFYANGKTLTVDSSWTELYFEVTISNP